MKKTASDPDVISQGVQEQSTEMPLGPTLPTEQDQVQYLVQAQSLLLDMLVHGQDLSLILDTLCLRIENVLSATGAMVMLIDEGGKLRTKAGPSSPLDLQKALEEMAQNNLTKVLMISESINHLLVVNNTAGDSTDSQIHELRTKHGIQAVWLLPVLSKQDKPIGVLALLFQQSRSPRSFDVQTVHTFTNLVTLSVQQLIDDNEGFQDLFNSAPIAYFSSSIEGKVIRANTGTAQLTGIPQRELPGHSLLDLFSPSIRGRKKAQRIHEWIKHGLEVEEEELELERADGSRRWVSLTVRLIGNSLGQPIERRGILEDITDRKRTEFLLDQQRLILEMIARGHPIHQILKHVCQGVETLSPTLTCSVHQLKGATLHFLAGPHLPDTYARHTKTIEIGPAAGSCGTAAFRRKPIIVSDIATDLLWANWRTLALKHGFQACWSLPLFSSENEVLGTLAMYAPLPCTPSEQDWKMITAMTKLAEIALEQDQARSALKQSEARLRQVIDLVPHFIFAKDKQGRFILANQATAEVYGTTVQDILGKTDDDFTQSHAEAKHFRRKDLEVLTTGIPQTLEESITDSEGNVRKLHTTKIPFEFSDTGPTAILGVAIDVTALKQGEEALQLTQHVFDNLPDLVSVIGPDYRYRRVNAVYEQIHGIPLHKLKGKHLSDVLGHEIFLHHIKPYFDRCLAGETISYEQWFPYKEWLPFQDGQERYMTVTYSPLWSKEEPQTVKAVVITARDLTSRKHTEEALKESEGHLRILLDERTRLSQDLHDRVLQSIYAVGLIIAAIRKPLEHRQFSEVQQFLDQAVSQVNNSILDLRGFIEGCPQDHQDFEDFSSALHSLTQSMTIPDGPTFKICLDHEAVNRLHKQEWPHLINIAREAMSNCLRHAQATKGHISLTKKNGNLKFEIRDNGIGFDPQTRSPSGHGLVNMKARSEHVDGKISIHSAPHKGTRVIITLPISTSTRGM